MRFNVLQQIIITTALIGKHGVIPGTLKPASSTRSDFLEWYFKIAIVERPGVTACQRFFEYHFNRRLAQMSQIGA